MPFRIRLETGTMPLRRFKQSSRRRLMKSLDSECRSAETKRKAEEQSESETVKRSMGDVARIAFLLSLFLTIFAWLLGAELPPPGRPL